MRRVELKLNLRASNLESVVCEVVLGLYVTEDPLALSHGTDVKYLFFHRLVTYSFKPERRLCH